MKNEIKEIKSLILSNIDPEKIIFLNLGPIKFFLVVWNATMSRSEKRVLIRRILKFVNVVIDICVYSSEELSRKMEEQCYLTCEIEKRGIVLFEKI